MLEKKIEKLVCDYAKQKGMLSYKFTSPMHAGVCDRIWICKGETIYVEFKQKGKKPTKQQERHHQKLIQHGAVVYVIDDVELGKEIIDHEWEDETKPHRSAVRNLSSN